MTLSRLKIRSLWACALFALVVAPAVAQCGADWAPSGLFNMVDGQVLCSVVYDDGTGPKLYVGGSFGTTGGAPASGVCVWNGTAWSGVGGGISGGSVNSLCVHNDGTGNALYACGWFGTIGPYVAKFNGSNWVGVGQGFNNGAACLASYNDGSGQALYCGGYFSVGGSGGVALRSISKFNGTSWVPVGTGASAGTNGSVTSLCVYNNYLYVGGSFGNANGVVSANLARWNGAWSAVTASSAPASMITWDDGTGLALWVGGYFTTIGGVSASRVAKYNGTAWTALGTGLSGFCNTVCSYDDGTGPALYAGGTFLSAGGNAAPRIAKWSSGAWSAVGGGIPGGTVQMLGVWPNSPTGPRLYVGGNFPSVGTTPYVIPELALWGPTPPAVVTQPASIAVNDGAQAQFSVVATGVGNTYQWRQNLFNLGANPLPGANSATLTIATALPLNWGAYDCVISNGCGSTTTAIANLTLNPALNLTMTQPYGTQSFYLQHQGPGQGGLNYFTNFSFDPLNSAAPGMGPFWGSWTTLNDIIGQYQNGFPPFAGTLDGSGNALFILGAGQLPAFLVGQTVTAVSCAFNNSLAVLTNSNVVTISII